MKKEQLLRVTVTSALNEAQKMVTQKFPITAATFDPFKSDTQDFTLSHERKAVPAPEKAPRRAAPKAKPAAVPPQEEEEEDREGPLPAERLKAPPQEEQKKAAARPLIGEIDRKSLRRAIVLSEILSPPLARRGGRQSGR